MIQTYYRIPKLNGLRLCSRVVSHSIGYIVILLTTDMYHMLEFGTSNKELFKTFMDSLNVIPSMLENSPNQIWITASSYTTAKSPNRDAYIQSVIPHSTSYRGVIRALNNNKLRETIDHLIKIPMFELTISNLNFWSSLGSTTV
jgi:hypothetical protein